MESKPREYIYYFSAIYLTIYQSNQSVILKLYLNYTSQQIISIGNNDKIIAKAC